jgi:hypothetical protein
VYRTSDFGFGEEIIEDVHFSRDGNHLIVHTSTSEAPEVIPIDSNIISTSTKLHGSPHTDSNTLATSRSSGPSIQVLAASGSAQFESTTSVVDSSRASGMNVVHASGQVTIRKWSSSGEGSERQTKAEVLRLTRLPAWDTLASSSVAIRAPQAGDKKIRAVLNKSARQWDDMVQDADAHLPALVSRDVASLEVQNSEGRFQRLGNGGVMRQVENS